jgi:oligopeptide/dipeptide ABC transporter ATP-binding protein
VSVQAQLLNLLDALRAARSMTMIFISHDMTVVEYFCDRVAVMYLGLVMELLSAADLPRNSFHPYTRSLRASAPSLDAFEDSFSAGESAARVYGETPDPRALIKGCPFAPRCSEAMPSCSEVLPELREASSDHWVRCWAIHNS